MRDFTIDEMKIIRRALFNYADSRDTDQEKSNMAEDIADEFSQMIIKAKLENIEKISTSEGEQI